MIATEPQDGLRTAIACMKSAPPTSPEAIPSLCFTYAITAAASAPSYVGLQACSEVLVMANIPELACLKIIGGHGCA